jgi:cellobiose phosphorylase
MGAVQEPGNSQGFAIDPILSLRQSLNISPAQRVQVSMILASATTREQVLNMMGKYADPHAIDQAMDLPGLAQLELRLSYSTRRRAAIAAGAICYIPNSYAAREQLLKPRGQAGLWAYGISGDCRLRFGLSARRKT